MGFYTAQDRGYDAKNTQKTYLQTQSARDPQGSDLVSNSFVDRVSDGVLEGFDEIFVNALGAMRKGHLKPNGTVFNLTVFPRRVARVTEDREFVDHDHRPKVVFARSARPGASRSDLELAARDDDICARRCP
jgi:hypothetical protein